MARNLGTKATIATSSADSVITREEARTIRARWEELKSVTEGFVTACESGTFGAIKTEAPTGPAAKGQLPAKAAAARGSGG